MKMREYFSYRVWYCSVPGMYAQYDGFVAVDAHDKEHADKLAFRKLRETFPDRTRDMWRLVEVEKLD